MSKGGFESNKGELLKKLKQAEERALEGVGVFVTGEASARSPVDTGNLRSSINHQVNAGEKSVKIGSPVEYGIYIEKGTSKMSAQPFLEPAVTKNRGRIKSLIGELMTID